MADRFLREVMRMHQLRADINEMTPEEAGELIRGLGDAAAEDWVFAARDAQLPPPDLSWCWLFLGGRGAGKSHSMSAAVHTAIRWTVVLGLAARAGPRELVRALTTAME